MGRLRQRGLEASCLTQSHQQSGHSVGTPAKEIFGGKGVAIKWSATLAEEFVNLIAPRARQSEVTHTPFPNIPAGSPVFEDPRGTEGGGSLIPVGSVGREFGPSKANAGSAAA